MSFFKTRLGVAVLLGFGLLVLFLVRPGAGSLKARITRSISQSLGRPVDIGSVSLRFLPPGFELENLVVYDDAAFGVEPILRSPEVTASVRVLSLFRGHLDIARLNLSDPSLNLVRSGGSWNVSKLLERSAETLVAPTTSSHAPIRPSFPYIEANHARINFKIGQEKKPLALTEAQFSIWQDSSDSWGVRLKAQPIRSDSYLTDTGLIRVEGTWQRSAALWETPLQLNVAWEGAQLGQISKLVDGRDRGWRGTLTWSSVLSGKASAVTITSSAQVEDFRRYDVGTNEPFTLHASCRATYSAGSRVLSDMDCETPAHDGRVKVTGSVDMAHPPRSYELKLTAERVPVSSLTNLLRHVGHSIPADLAGTGELTGDLFVKSTGGKADWQGFGRARNVTLSSKSGTYSLGADEVPLRVVMASNPRTAVAYKHQSVPAPAEAQLLLGPVPISRNPGGAMTGEVDGGGYVFSLAGKSDLAELADAAKLLGLAVPRLPMKGSASSHLQVAGSWGDGEQLTGSIQLADARVEVRGLSVPLEIASATIAFQPGLIRVTALTATAAASTWHGTVELPRPCEPRDCIANFDLRAAHVSLDDVGRLLNPARPSKPWYDILSSETTGPAVLLSVKAHGKISIDSLQIRNLSAAHVTSKVDLDAGKLWLNDLRGNFLGGKHVGSWSANFKLKPPQYSGDGKLEKVSLQDVARHMKEDWISGSADAGYQIRLTGYTAAELTDSAKATLDVSARQGVLHNIFLSADGGPLAMREFTGKLSLNQGIIEVQDGRLETPSGTFDVSGKASLARNLDLHFAQSKQSYRISGSLAQPKVAVVAPSPTQASLKP